MRLGFIGAGRMGRPMAHRLTSAGHRVRVLGHSAAGRRALAAEGFEVVDAPADLDADAVLVCVLTDDQLAEVCLGGGLLDSLTAGSTVIVHTTASLRTTDAIVTAAAARGIDVVDAPVSGGPHDIAAGRITLFVGGTGSAVARVQPVLACYGDPVLHLGPAGTGQRVKLVNNALFAAQLGLLLDAVRIGTQWTIDEAALLRGLAHGSAAGRAVTGAAARGSAAGFGRSIAEFLGKDVAAVRAVAADLGSLDAALRTLADAVEPTSV
jgi:3-hydroxyisobutyrate dehydrogenase-like beta-hydroxyacid dehydrogenase